MLELAFLVFFVLAAFGAGSFLLGIFRFRFSSFLEELSFSIALGYGIVALLTYLLGFYGLLYRQAFLLLFLALLALSFGRIRHAVLAVSRWLSSLRALPALNMFSALVAVMIFFAVFNLLASLAPPWSYDTTMYHLAVPKIYADEHGFVALPSLIHSNLVMAPHMLFLAAIVVKDGVLANLVNFTFSVLLALGIFSFCRRFLGSGKKVGILASSIFFSLPIISVYSVSAYADIPLAFFAFSAFYAFVVWAERGSERGSGGGSTSGSLSAWLVFSAFMAGLAAGSKLTGIAFVAVMAALIFFYRLFGRKHESLPQSLPNLLKSLLKTAVFPVAIFTLLALAVSFPAYLKNWVYSGNPFFPMLFNVFGGKFLNADVAAFFSATLQLQRGTSVSLGNFLLIPWNITMFPLKFIEQLGIGPLFLAFVPLLVFVRRNRIIMLVLAAGLLPLVSWFVTSQALRYATFAFPFLSIVTAFVIYSLANSSTSNLFRHFVTAVVAVVIASNAILLFGANAKQLPVALGLESEGQFFEKLGDGNIYAICKFANSNLPENAEVLLLYEYRGYPCDMPYVIGEPKQQIFIDYSKISSAEDYAKRLAEIGITDIIVNGASPVHKPGEGTYRSETASLIESLLEDYGVLLHSEGEADLYSFSYNAS